MGEWACRQSSGRHCVVSLVDTGINIASKVQTTTTTTFFKRVQIQALLSEKVTKLKLLLQKSRISIRRWYLEGRNIIVQKTGIRNIGRIYRKKISYWLYKLIIL